MKRLIFYLIILLVIVFCSTCNNKYRHLVIVAERIEYDVQVKNDNSEADWWVQNLEGSKRDALMKTLTEGLKSGKLQAFENDADVMLSPESFNEALGKLGNSGDITRLRFTEKWFVNTKTLRFEKRVVYVSPIIVKDSIYEPLLRIKFDTTETEEERKAVSEKIQYDVTINNDKAERDKEQQLTKNAERADNWWFENIETSKRENLVNLISEAAFSEKFVKYDYFNEKIKTTALKKEFYWTENISMYRPNPPYDKYDTIIKHTLDKKNITRLRFMEEWFIGEKTYILTKEVKGICPVMRRFREDGELKGYMPMFWIYFDRKYPAAVKAKE